MQRQTLFLNWYSPTKLGQGTGRGHKACFKFHVSCPSKRIIDAVWFIDGSYNSANSNRSVSPILNPTETRHC